MELLIVILALVLVAGGAYKALNWLGNRHLSQIADAATPRCRQCGYDIRATPDLCPECGTPAAARPVLALEAIDFEGIQNRWPIEPLEIRRPGAHEVPVELVRSTDRDRVEFLNEFLQLRGIPSSVFYDEQNEVMGAYAVSVPRATLRVWSDDVETVKDIAEHFSKHRVESTTLTEPSQ